MNSTNIKNLMTGVQHELVGFIIALTGIILKSTIAANYYCVI